MSKAGSVLVLLEKPIQQSDNLFTGRFERTLDILALPMRNQNQACALSQLDVEVDIGTRGR